SRRATWRRSRASGRCPSSRASCPPSSPPTRSAGSCADRFPRGPRSSSASPAGATRTSIRCGRRSPGRAVVDLESTLRARRSAGGRAFVPYVTGGLPGVDAALLRALEEAGADAVEVGIPFSDPVMDGGVIQEASRIALERGARPGDVLDTVAAAADSGVSGIIVPDLPVDEAEEWTARCAERAVAPVFLAAPGSSEERLR